MTRPVLRSTAIGLCILLLGMHSPVVWANDVSTPPPSDPPTATTSYPLVDADFSLGISPTRLEIGQGDLDSTQQVLVFNKGRLPAAVTVQKRNFVVSLDGAIVFQDDAPYAASEWVTVSPAQFEVPSGEGRTVTLSVQTPVSPDPGDYQLALVFVVPAAQDSGNIRINKGVGLPAYITVPGPIVDSAVLNGLDVDGFAIDGPVTINATIENTGTVHRDFRGPTALTVDTAGTPVPFGDFTVPRGATRNISTTWDPPLICVCNPTVQFTNADGSLQSATVQVIVFPLKLVGLILLAILIIVLVVVLARRRHRMNATIADAERHYAGRGDG